MSSLRTFDVIDTGMASGSCSHALGHHRPGLAADRDLHDHFGYLDLGLLERAPGGDAEQPRRTTCQ